jgi:hypothetical protein
MKQQEILKKISHILHELNEQFDYLHTAETHLNDLELELFAANAKFLTDHTEILRKVNLQSLNAVISLPEHAGSADQSFVNQTVPVIINEPVQPIEDVPLPQLSEKALAFDSYVPPKDEPQPSTPAFIKEPINDQIAVHEHTSDIIETQPEVNLEPATAQESFGFVRTEPDVSSNSHSFSISSSHTEEEKPPHVNLDQEITPEQTDTDIPASAAVETKAPKPELKPEPAHYFNQHTIAAEPVAAEPVITKPSTEPVIPPVPEQSKTETEQPLTLNQRLSAQLQQQAPAQSPAYNSPAVTDIKSAINLNDKMLFVKDLFNGYSLAYSEAVDLLNRCKNFDEADRFLRSNYVTKNNWASKPDTVDKFYMILHRRFTV